MIRIVKMTFVSEHCNDFLEHFDLIKEKIVAKPGCNSLRMHRDLNDPNIFFTYSDWDNEDALQAYRKSELFIETWSIIKQWFSVRAVAWSVDTKFDSGCQ